MELVTENISQQVDSSSVPVETSVNIQNYASFYKRAFALMLDQLFIGFIELGIYLGGIFIGFLVINLSVFSKMIFSMNINTSGLGTTVGQIVKVINLIFYFYYQVYFIGRYGQTPGQKHWEIKVLDSRTMLPPGYLLTIIRYLTSLVSGLFIFGYLWMLWDKKKQTWHDKIAHTVVIQT